MRPIDADALLKEFDPDNNEPISNIGARMKIVQAPTAYDVDKVVEQIKELHERYDCTDNEFQRGAKAGAHYILNRVIEIVKGGGVDA